MSLIRFVLGRIILLIDWITSPRSPKRTAEAQQVIDSSVADLVLYQYHACPFCVKVRREMKRLGVKIELRDPKRSDSAREELINGGGKLKVPCLRIEDSETQWLYESDAIIAYLGKRVA